MPAILCNHKKLQELRIIVRDCLGYWRLLLALIASLAIYFVLASILKGDNYSQFVVRIEGVSDEVLQDVRIEFESVFGSRGTLDYNKGWNLFHTVSYPQPIRRIWLKTPTDSGIREARIVLWYMQIAALFSEPLISGGQYLTPGEADRRNSTDGGVTFNLNFRPMSNLSVSRYARAMNWKGDLSLLLRSVVRAFLVVSGGFICWLAVRSGASSLVQVNADDGGSGLPTGISMCAEDSISTGEIGAWIGLIGVLVTIVFIRDPQVFLLPALELEDGAMIFAHFYEHRNFSEILRFKAGYIPLLPNLTGFLSVRIPYVFSPFFLSFVPLCLSIVVFSYPFRRSCANLFPSRFSAWVTCVVLALAPVGSRHLVGNTDYLIWNSLALLFVLSLKSPLKRGAGAFLFAFGLLLLISSHPLSLLLIPVLVVRWICEGTLPWYWVHSIGAALLYQALGVEHNAAVRDHGVGGQIPFLFKAGVDSSIICGNVAVRCLLGPAGVDALSIATGDWSGGYALIMVTVLVLWLGISFPSQRHFLFYVVFVVWSLTFLSVLARGAGLVEEFGPQVRYVYIQSMILLWVGCCGFFWCVEWLRKRLNDCGFGQLRIALSLAPVLLIGWFSLLNYQIGCFDNSANKYNLYRCPGRDHGWIIRNFMTDLTRLEREVRPGEGFRLEAVKDGDWNVVIDTRSAEKGSQ